MISPTAAAAAVPSIPSLLFPELMSSRRLLRMTSPPCVYCPSGSDRFPLSLSAVKSLQTNLPAPSFYPSQMRADQDGQSLNPRAASQMQQRPHGPAGDVSSGLFLRCGVDGAAWQWCSFSFPFPKHNCYQHPTSLLHNNLSGEREGEGEKNSRLWGHFFCALIWALTQVSGVRGWRGGRGCEPPLPGISQPLLSHCSTAKRERASATQWPWGGRTTEPGWGQSGCRGGTNETPHPLLRSAHTRCPCARHLWCQASRQVARLLCDPEKSNYSQDNLIPFLLLLLFFNYFSSF